MIEIKRITEQEVPYVSELARVVYRSSIAPQCPDQGLWQMFDRYVERESLAERFREGQILLWGAFEAGQLYGVGGMQPEGHITMLYVLPPYQRRNIGRNLLAMMESYAFSELKLNRVTVSAMPAWTSPYFQRNGFWLMQQTGGPAFVFLEKKNQKTVAYQVRHLSVPKLVGLSIGALAGISLLSLVYAISTVL